MGASVSLHKPRQFTLIFDTLSFIPTTVTALEQYNWLSLSFLQISNDQNISEIITSNYTSSNTFPGSYAFFPYEYPRVPRHLRCFLSHLLKHIFTYNLEDSVHPGQTLPNGSENLLLFGGKRGKRKRRARIGDWRL